MNKSCFWAVLVVICVLSAFLKASAVDSRQTARMTQSETISWNPSLTLPWFMSTQLPNGVLGLVIAGLFAAAMSTLSASMNSSSAAYLTDIYPKLKRPSQASFPAPEDGKQMLRLARPVTLVLEVLGVLGGLFLLRMTTTRANSFGAACG